MSETSEKRRVEPDDLLNMVGLEDPRLSPDGQWVAFVRVQADKAKNSYLRNVWLAHTDGTRVFALTRSGKDSTPRWSPDGRFLAFVSGRADKAQVYLFEMGRAGDPRKLTDAPNGVSGLVWSPDGRHIAYLAGMSAADRAYEDDPEGAPKPTEDDEKKKADPRVIKGMPYRVGTSYLSDKFSQIYVLEVVAEEASAPKPRRLTHVDANHSEPCWTPDGTALLLSRVDEVGHDEPGRYASVYRVDVQTGEHTRLTDDSHADDRPILSADGRYLAWGRFPREQMALKYSRLAVRELSTGQTVDVNLAIDVNPVGAVWCGDVLYFNAQVNGRTWIYRWAGELSAAPQPVVTFDGRADRFDALADGTIAYVGFNAMTLAELYLQTPEGQTRQLTQMNAPLRDGVLLPTWERMTWEREGVQLEGWYALPPDLPASHKPPLIVDIHGGPHIMWSPHYENEWHNWQTVLGAGYAVFIANPRGSTGYGEAFQMAIHRTWGDRAQGDILTGLDAFLALDLVDTARMGVMGGSYGGYMTAWIAARDQRFKAALAERGVYNLISFTGTTDIPTFIADEFGLELFDDPATLWAHSPLAYADQIRMPLLIIHSENDFRVAISEAEQLFAAVRRAGHVPVEFVRYPREGHELSRAGEPEHRIDRLNRIIGWFDRWLK